MRTNLDLITYPDDHADIAPADFAGFHHPREIVADPELSIARKRAMLSRWMSDIGAVPGTPGARLSPAGVMASVDQIRAALAKLDEMVEAIALLECTRPGGHLAA